jgi:hypothetical protein
LTGREGLAKGVATRKQVGHVRLRPAGDSKSGYVRRKRSRRPCTRPGAFGACSSCCVLLARASYTSLRHTHAHLHYHISPHSGPIDLTSLDLTYVHLSIPSSPSRRYRSALARLIASTLASPALRGPRITKLHVDSLSGEQRPYLGYHRTALTRRNLSLLLSNGRRHHPRLSMRSSYACQR